MAATNDADSSIDYFFNWMICPKYFLYFHHLINKKYLEDSEIIAILMGSHQR